MRNSIGFIKKTLKNLRYVRNVIIVDITSILRKMKILFFHNPSIKQGFVIVFLVESKKILKKMKYINYKYILVLSVVILLTFNYCSPPERKLFTYKINYNNGDKEIIKAYRLSWERGSTIFSDSNTGCIKWTRFSEINTRCGVRSFEKIK